MCCFIVPMVQAIATSAYRKATNNKNVADLEKMLWGGTAMLIVDHVINGELTWRFPFFTALGEVGGAEVMLHEMLTVGVPMSLVLTAIWGTMVAIRKTRRETNTI